MTQFSPIYLILISVLSTCVALEEVTQAPGLCEQHVWTTADRIARVEREAADMQQRVGLAVCCFYACCACACVLYHTRTWRA